MWIRDAGNKFSWKKKKKNRQKVIGPDILAGKVAKVSDMADILKEVVATNYIELEAKRNENQEFLQGILL